MDAESVRLYLELSENSLELVQKYFNLTKPLYFDYTHLVCRTALDGMCILLPILNWHNVMTKPLYIFVRNDMDFCQLKTALSGVAMMFVEVQ